MRVRMSGVVEQEGYDLIHNTNGAMARYGQLWIGGYGENVKMFPFNSSLIKDAVGKHRRSAEAADWERVKKMVELQEITISREECQAHRDELMAWVENKSNWWPTYARRNPVLYHSYDWTRALTTIKFIEGGVNTEEAVHYPVTVGLDGNPFRKVYHPWESNHIILLDWKGNECGEHGRTWEQLLATGGPADGINLWFPTGTQEGHDAIVEFNK